MALVVTADRPEREPPSLALSAAPWAGPWAWVAAPRRKARVRSQQALPRLSRQMSGGAPVPLMISNFSFHCPWRFRRRRGEGARIPTVRTKRSAPGAVRIERRDGLPRRRQRPLVDCFVERREGAQPPGARGRYPRPNLNVEAVIASELLAGPQASCARPRHASEARPATASAVPRISWGRSVDRHRPWRNP